MFLRTVKNRVAFGIFGRISAIRIAEHRNIYELAATIVEAVNWASKRMNGFPQQCSEKEYNAVHRFWVKLRRVIDKRFIQYIEYNEHRGEYEVVLPDSCLRLVSSHWRGLESIQYKVLSDEFDRKRKQQIDEGLIDKKLSDEIDRIKKLSDFAD